MVSVIIPCYNAESTIKKCIKSVLNQTFQDFEIVVVNDGSTDSSLFIVQRLQRKYKQIKLLNKTKNEGLGQARFDGLKFAGGDFVTFLDSDDWFDRFALQNLFNAIKEDNYDYVEMGVTRVIGKHGWIKRKINQSVLGSISQPELFDKYFISFYGVNSLSVAAWGKLYRKSFLDSVDLKPSPVVLGEDLFMNLTLFPHLSKIKILDYPGYYYRYGGMTTKYNPRLLKDLVTLYFIKRRIAENYNFTQFIPYMLIELKIY